jgi:hypothetical protein
LKKAMIPAATNPNVNSVVATGRRINGLERLISELDPRSPYTLSHDPFNDPDCRPGIRADGEQKAALWWANHGSQQNASDMALRRRTGRGGLRGSVHCRHGIGCTAPRSPAFNWRRCFCGSLYWRGLRDMQRQLALAMGALKI